jgi:predicted metal-dependent phosphoesterase TrpH
MVDRPTFDLQSHSTRSDGALEPAAVVAAAAQAGVEVLALSDHDTVEGVDEALTAADEHGIKVVTATELSSVDGDKEDLHVLGYAIDHHSQALAEALAAFREDREARGWRMADALEELGWAVNREPLQQRRDAGRPIGRPHLAMAAFDHPDNAGRIADEGFATFSDLLVAYLIPGAPAFRRRTTPTVHEAITTIHEAGGVAIWAHPFWDVDAPEDVLAMIDRYREAGLDGVEVFYTTFTREQIEFLDDACTQRGLLTTGSADFHGPEHPHFSRFRAFELHGRTPNLGPIG